MTTGRAYQCKGDLFTAQVERGDGPPTVIYWLNQNTGRRYCTRVPVHRCYALRASDAVEAVRNTVKQLPELGRVDMARMVPLLALDWEPYRHALAVRLTEQERAYEAGVWVRLTVTETGKPGARGARGWLSCPRCTRRCGVVYVSPWNSQGLRLPYRGAVGCRSCLGLTDESRQRHKCLDWAGAVLGLREYAPGKQGRYQRRGESSTARAHRVDIAAVGRALRGFSGR